MLSLRWIFLFLLTACSMNQNKGPPSLSPQYVFQIKGKEAKIVYEKKLPSYGKMTLQEVEPHVLYYTNVLQEESSRITLEVFLERWKCCRKVFQPLPPVATLIFTEAGASQSQSVELKEFVYDQEEKLLTLYLYFLSPFAEKNLSNVTFFVQAPPSYLTNAAVSE